MKAIVVYYSLEGNTKMVAEKIAEKLGVQILELKPVKAFPTGNVSKFFWGGKSATFKEKPELENYSFAADDYDTVILGTPLWAWNITPPMRTFLTDNQFAGKRIAAFIACGGGDASKAFETIRELTGAEKLAAELKLVNPLDNAGAIDAEIEEFCKKMEA